MSTPPAAQRPRTGWRRPLLQFVAAGLVAAVLLTLATVWFSRQAARDEAVFDAQQTTELLARSVVEPGIPAGLIEGESAAVDRFDRLVRGRVLGGPVLRVKLWTAEGTIVYSDEPRLNGKQFALDPDEQEILRDGGTAAELSDLSDPENRFDQAFDQVVEVYTPIEAPDGEWLLFEVYFSAAEVTERADDVVGAFRPISIGGLTLFFVLTVPLVWVLARRLDAAAAEREALLQAAMESSDVERRRIARDLHDGVVQDLAGTAFALSASSRASEVPELRSRLNELADAVRGSLRMLRSLLVDFYPPDLYSAGLAAAFDDLVAPAVTDGVDIRLEVTDTTGVPDDVVGLLWRVGQEAVRNALRHGRPHTLTVRVRRADAEPPMLVLEVVDDGCGFDSSEPAGTGHFGLRVVHDLAAAGGGTLRVRSQPGRGTHVTLEVAER